MTPVESTTQFTAEVISNEPVIRDANVLWVDAPNLASKARPGQFAMLLCGDSTYLRRPLSIHRINDVKTRVAFLYGIVGKGTAWLSGVRAGSTLDLIAPLGNGFSVDGRGPATLVAGGLGIAPLVFLADELRKSGRDTTLLYGASTSDLLCQVYSAASDNTVLVTEDGTRGRKGLVTVCLPEFLKGNPEIFACGPASMLRALACMKELSTLKTQLSLEIRMACGLGVCYGCSVNTLRGMEQVCKHGPVFYLRDILWDGFVGI